MLIFLVPLLDCVSLFLVSDDPKNAFLKQLENAPENLQLFEADVLDCGSLTAAFAGCEGVFHLATPVPEEKIVDPQASNLSQQPKILSCFCPSAICISAYLVC